MLWTIIVVLVVFWALGFIGGASGSLIHLLPIAAMIPVAQLATGSQVRL